MQFKSSLNLCSETPLQKDELRRIRTIWQLIWDNADSEEFRQPVDWESLELLDYWQVVKNPMDLGTIQENIRDDKYHFVEEILDDFQLIWDNCRLYNEESSWIYNVADRLDKYFKKLIRNYFNNVVVAQPNTKKGGESLNPMSSLSTPRASNRKKMVRTYNEDDSEGQQSRVRLMEKLKKLSADHLGILMKMLVENCPRAFQEVEQGKFSVLMDQMDEQLVSEMNEKIAELSVAQDKLTKRIKT